MIQFLFISYRSHKKLKKYKACLDIINKMLQIYYTGTGLKENRIHTVKEFIAIMNNLFPYRDFNLEEWLEFSGAEIMK
jgi:hypothetical protein